MRLLLDEMIPPAVARELRRHGHDVQSVAERRDLRTFPDEQVFAVAQTEGRVIVTRDRADYLALDRAHREAGLSHAGLILVPSRIPGPAVGPLVKPLRSLVEGPAPHPGFVHWL